MGTHLEIFGQGCRFLESHWRENFKWSDFFVLAKCYALKKATRLDLAFDDFKGLLNISTLAKKTENGDLVTRFRNWKYFRSGEIYKSEKVGETFW